MINDMETLPDYLRAGLTVVSIGLNPSLPSVASGFYFANPRNRFWKALDGSGIVPVPLPPGEDSQDILFHSYGFGFTDVVKRPSAGMSALRATDYREGAPVLRDKLLLHQPLIAWFHGKEAYRNYRKYSGATNESLEWGEQPHQIGQSHVFMTPNPSPANAAFSLEVLIDWYRKLGELRAGLFPPS